MIGEAVQVYGQGSIGIVISGKKTKEWYDRGASQWKSFDYHLVLLDGHIIKVDPFSLKSATDVCNESQ